MKAGLIIQGGLAALLLLVGLLCEAASQRFYPATIPFLTAAATCVFLAVRGMCVPDKAPRMFWLLTPLHGLLFLPFWFAMSRWPGGDDGPGMFWLTVVGGGSCLAGGTSLVFVIIGGLDRSARKMPRTRPSDSELSGMTVNERLFACGLMEAFDDATRDRNRERMISLLMQTAVASEQAERTTDAVLANPEMYGY